MKLVFAMAGGGTGGHIIPALAVAEELRRRGHEAFFFGRNDGMEARLVPAAGFSMEWIRIGALNRVSLLQRFKTLWQLPLSVLRVARVFGARRPAAVFSMGGYVAGPVVLAAWLLRVPIVLMEPNAIPGLTNRRLARIAARALVNFPETLDYFPPGRGLLTGVPVRRPFFEASASATRPFTLLVTGGSQGSRTLNNAGRDSWPRFAGKPIRIVHQAGRSAAGELQRVFDAAGIDGEVTAFINDMPAAFASADLIVSRAGASTVSEIAAAGKPSILVPFPFAADNHQQKNAEALARAGAARMILDADMTGERLHQEVSDLMRRPGELAEMGRRAREFAKPDAASRAADALEEAAKSFPRKA